MKRLLMVMLSAMMLSAFGTTNVNAQNRIDLEDAMFKAWDGCLPGSQVVEEPEQVDGNDFACDNNMYRKVGGGETIYGSYKVYYLWYANLTGTNTMYFEGTPGVQLRILINRPEPDGDDNHGGTTTELNCTIDEGGYAKVDLSSYEYVHLNAIKTGWGSPQGKITRIEIEGSVESTGQETKKEPIDLLSVGYEADVVAINLGSTTNLGALTGSLDRLIFPDECVSVKVNGEPVSLLSVEGIGGNRLFAFIDEGYPESSDDVVEVSFTNPDAPDYHLVFTDGQFEGQALPSFTDMKATLQEGLGEYYSYQAAIPQLIAAEPADNSFNLPLDQKTFKLTFSANVKCESLQAMLSSDLGQTDLTVTPSAGLSKEVTLTRQGADLIPGEYTLVVSGIEPEMNFLEQQGELALTLNFGPVDLTTDDQPRDLLPISYFNDTKKGGIPEGFQVFFSNEPEPRTSASTYGSGACMKVFTEGGDFTRALYFRDQYVQYGYMEGYELTFEANKRYNISFSTAAWKGNTNMLFEIIDNNDEVVFSQVVASPSCEIGGSQDIVVTGSNSFKTRFVAESDGNYYLRWSPCDANGTPSGWAENLLANVVVSYVPSTAGVGELLMVAAAVEEARQVLDENADERYAGVAYDALKQLMNTYGDKNFTNAADCQAAAQALSNAAQALKEHHTLCDTYDVLPGEALDIVAACEGTLFDSTPYYAALKDAAYKYSGKVLTDDQQLQAAISELNRVIANAKGMFTEGMSANGTTGYAALHERLRIGIATAQALGLASDHSAIAAANSTLGDDDQVARQLQTATTMALYKRLAEGDATLFSIDETGEPATYDMSVFMKNPNIYVTKASKTDMSAENAPGWTVTSADGTNSGLTWCHNGGSANNATDDVPADEALTQWEKAVDISQQLSGLPAGTYSVVFYLGERKPVEELDEAWISDIEATLFAYAKPAEADTLKAPVACYGSAWGATADNRLVIEGITVTDGQLTIGVKGGSRSHFAFNEVHIVLTAPAAGYDYSKDLQGLINGINDTTVAPAASSQYYDLQGRRVDSNARGMVVVRTTTADGRVLTRKVMK